MGDVTGSKSLWSQSVYDSLFSALRHNASDDTVKDLLADLAERGQSTTRVAARVKKALGRDAATRVVKIGAVAGHLDDELVRPARAAPRPRYRISRLKLAQIRFGEYYQTLGDGCYDLREWLCARGRR